MVSDDDEAGLSDIVRGYGELWGGALRSMFPSRRREDDAFPFEAAGYGGWGGHEYLGTEPGHDRTPVVCLHGNTRDADDYRPHADALIEEGYGGDAIYSVTFPGQGMSHDAMAETIDTVIDDVLEYTGAEAVDVVAHSLSVTGMRRYMGEYGSGAVNTFIGVAGANHGTPLADTAAHLEPVYEEITTSAAADGWLAERNAAGLPEDIEGHTVRGGADVFFSRDPESPTIPGAEDHLLEGVTHMEALRSQEAVELIVDLLDGEAV